MESHTNDKYLLHWHPSPLLKFKQQKQYKIPSPLQNYNLEEEEVTPWIRMAFHFTFAANGN